MHQVTQKHAAYRNILLMVFHFVRVNMFSVFVPWNGKDKCSSVHMSCSCFMLLLTGHACYSLVLRTNFNVAESLKFYICLFFCIIH